MKANLIPDPVYGYLRVDPVPTAAEVDRFYREEFYGRARANYVNDSGLDNMREEADYHRRSYADLLEILRTGAGREPADLAVADVGCGFGYWLKFLADHGVNGYGVEPVQEGIDHCREQGIEGYCVPIENLAQPPSGKRVPAVSMINVLEHLRDPARVLKAFRQTWLAPRGHVLIRVPNEFNPLQVTANRLHNLDQWWVVPPQHINYFSRESLCGLLDACGYDIIDTMATFPLEMFLLMNDVYVGDAAVGKQIHRKRVAFEKNLDDAGLGEFRYRLYRQFAQLDIGREIIVLAKARATAG